MQNGGGGGLPASSSMVDLSAPGRRPSVSSLRHHASDANLRGPMAATNGGIIGLPVPANPLAEPSGSRPGTPNRPGSRKSEWVNPLDVHFVKDNGPRSQPGSPGLSPALTLGTSATTMPKSPLSPASPFSQFEFGLGGELKKTASNASADTTLSNNDAKMEDRTTTPSQVSPPAPGVIPRSPTFPVKSPERSISSSSRPGISRPSAPSALRRVETAPAGTLLDEPSPTAAAAASPVADQHQPGGEAPVIRNVRAKRDTLAMHTPRRRSFTMEVDEGGQEIVQQRRRRHEDGAEVLAGDFAGFDFGESVRRPSVDVQRGDAGGGGGLSEAAKRQKESLESASSRLKRSSPSPEGALQTIPPASKAASSTPALTSSAVSPIAPSIPAGPAPTPETTRATAVSRPSTSSVVASHRKTSPPADLISPILEAPPPPLSMRSRLGSGSRKAPPRPLQPAGLTAPERAVEPAPRSPYGPAAAKSNYIRNEPAPPRPNERLPSSPYARPPMEGDFPVSRGLPRGRWPGQPPADGRADSPFGRGKRSNDSRKVSDDDSFTLPPWDYFDGSDKHRSAVPAPLSTLRVGGGSDKMPGMPTSATAPPRIPSPTFTSLELSISSSSDDLARTFEQEFDKVFEKQHQQALASQVVLGGGGFAASRQDSFRGEPRRLAPPRPGPITVPPGREAPEGEVKRSPAVVERGFSAGFI